MRGPRPLALDDVDRDGLPDALEASLAARFAPAVILDPQEDNRPASIAWLLSRIGGLGRLDADRGSFPADVRAGSTDPRDWVTYVHVYPRTDGASTSSTGSSTPTTKVRSSSITTATGSTSPSTSTRAASPARRLLRAAREQQPGRLPRLERGPQDGRAPAGALRAGNPRQLRRPGFARLVRARQRLRRGRRLRRSHLANLGGGRSRQHRRARRPARGAGGARLWRALGQPGTLSPIEIGPAWAAAPAWIFERRIRLIGDWQIDRLSVANPRILEGARGTGYGLPMKRSYVAVVGVMGAWVPAVADRAPPTPTEAAELAVATRARFAPTTPTSTAPALPLARRVT